MTIALLSDRESVTPMRTANRNRDFPIHVVYKKCNIQRGEYNILYIMYMGIGYAKKRDLIEQTVKKRGMVKWNNDSTSPTENTYQHHREVFLFSAIASRYGSCLPFNPINNL